MGAAERWLRTLIGIKKSKITHGDHETLRSSSLSKSRRWIGWKMGLSRSRKEHQDVKKNIGCMSTRFLLREDFNDNSRLHIESWKAHWAAIRIQCAFRRHLKKEWCNHQGSIQDIQARHKQKCEGAWKRERAMAYASMQHPAAPKGSEITQLWQTEQHNSKVQAIQGISEIDTSYYCSGPILSSLPSPAARTGLSCTQKHHVSKNSRDCCKEETSPGMMRPGYMEATISMMAKSKSNVRFCTNSRNEGCHYSGYAYPVRRRYPSMAGLDTHNLLLRCK